MLDSNLLFSKGDLQFLILLPLPVKGRGSDVITMYSSCGVGALTQDLTSAKWMLYQKSHEHSSQNATHLEKRICVHFCLANSFKPLTFKMTEK